VQNCINVVPTVEGIGGPDHDYQQVPLDRLGVMSRMTQIGSSGVLSWVPGTMVPRTLTS
jgi:hypothetical protein